MADPIDTVQLAAELTAAWLANPNTRTSADDVPTFLTSMHAAVSRLANGTTPDEAPPPAETHEPATTARKSLASPDHIVSMIDGKKYKTLRRHLKGHGLTPEQYRERFNLKADYPMVAAAYSEARRAMAKTIGLGRKASDTVGKTVDTAATTVEATAGGAAAKVRKGAKSALAAAKQALGTDG